MMGKSAFELPIFTEMQAIDEKLETMTDFEALWHEHICRIRIRSQQPTANSQLPQC